MNTLKRLDHLERLIDALHREGITVYFDTGDVAQMPVKDLIPLLQQETGITHVSDNGTNGNGVIVDLINDLLEDENE